MDGITAVELGAILSLNEVFNWYIREQLTLGRQKGQLACRLAAIHLSAVDLISHH